MNSDKCISSKIATQIFFYTLINVVEIYSRLRTLTFHRRFDVCGVSLELPKQKFDLMRELFSG